MTDDERIEQVISALERLVEAERNRRAQREQMRASIQERAQKDATEIEAQIPEMPKPEAEAETEARRVRAQARMQEALEREKQLFATLQRQTELLELIVARLETRA